MLDVRKVNSLTIDVCRVANGAIPEPVFSGELSALSFVDPENETEWVRDYLPPQWIHWLNSSSLKGDHCVELPIQRWVHRF